jgi:23S rRNA (pseudouridine1915-N3)-methyltransferase
MKITLIFTSRTSFSFIKEGMNEYISRLKHYIPLEVLICQDLKNTKNMSDKEQKIKEGVMIMKLIPENSIVYLFDENGKEYNSVNFANFLNVKINEGRDICMVVGGAYGFSDELYSIARDKISLSKMTFSHQLVRILILEQIYRAFTILRGEPYHHV